MKPRQSSARLLACQSLCLSRPRSSMRPVSLPFPVPFLRLAKRPALLALGLTILAPLSAAAQDTSRIARVTVYPGSATVERVAKVTAGARSLTLASRRASSSGATGRVVSKSVLGVRRNSTWANSGSG